MKQEEFEILFRQYYAALSLYAERYLNDYAHAEDIVEGVFIKVLTMEKTSEVRNWAAFLYRCTRNACIDHLRSMQPLLSLELAELEHLAAHEDNVQDSEALKMEVYRELAFALEQLPAESGKVIRMAYLEGLPSKEIARKMNIAVSTVDNHKAKGLARLRRLLSKGALQLLLLGSL